MSRQDLTCSYCGEKWPNLHAWGMHEESCPVYQAEVASYHAKRTTPEHFLENPVSVGELTSALDAYPPSKSVKVLYVREGNQVWEYRIVNVSEDLLGVNLIIESARKVMNELPAS